VKDNYNLAIREVKRITNKKQPVNCWYDGEYKIEAFGKILITVG